MNFNIINIKILSDIEDKQKLYLDAMTQVFDLPKFQVNIGNKTGLVLKSIDKTSFPSSFLFDASTKINYSNYEILKCTFVKFKLVDSNDNFYDLNDNEIIPGDPNSPLKHNAHEIPFYFIPSIHRILLPLDSKISPLKLKLFFEKAFLHVYESKEFFNIDISKSSEEIDRIYSFQKLIRLNLNISYTNDDLGGVAKVFFDTVLKDAGVHKANSTYTAKTNDSLNMNSALIMGGIELSKENGDLKATGINKLGNKEIINTRDKFEEINIPADTSSEPSFLKSLLKSSIKIWRNLQNEQ